nr:hypothetical protein [Tanacetum cinerariifolium]
DITSTIPDEGTAKTTLRPEGSRGGQRLRGNKPPADVRAILLSEDEAQESEEDILRAGEEMDDSLRPKCLPHFPKEAKPTSSTTRIKMRKSRKPRKKPNPLHPPLQTWHRILDKEEEIKKAEEEAKLNAICKTKLIKVVREEAKKLGIHPKEAITTKAGELFKKTQDTEHELRKHKYDSYMWTARSRLKPEPITDIKIHPKTKPVVITVYRGADGRNFDFCKRLLFEAFGISELDELKEITPKKKNAVVKDLMNSLSQMYERLRKIHEELGIQSSLHASEQAPSQTSGRKRKYIELEPETRIPGLECNRALPENVSFVNNMVIEEPEYGIFFTGEFGDQAFQRWSDIDKVGMEAPVSYLVAVSMVKSPENARFSMKLRKLITEHPDQEKLKSKKVKLEALGYKMD